MRPPPLIPDSNDAPEDEDVGDDRPSKSELKRQMLELQQLGLALSEMSPARLKSLELPESLRDAIEDYQRTRSFEGRRRQMQFIGKLMRQVDAGPLREAIAASRLGSAKETLALHAVERWRDELMVSDDALTRWTAAHPSTDLQQMRSLLRAARKDAQAEQVDQRHGRAYRDLFQLIKSALAGALAAETDADKAEEPGGKDNE